MNQPAYSRSNPSPRYRNLLEQYRWLHEKGEPFLQQPPEKTFAGTSLPQHAPHVRRLIDRLGGIETILDYGSGKGQQYTLSSFLFEGETLKTDIRSYWGVSEIRCFDPAYPPFSVLPDTQYDGVVCTDVLEHCPEEDLPWILEEIFNFGRRFVYASVACFPARKLLPTGENAHCTVKPRDWWKSLIREVASRHPGLAWEFQFVEREPDGRIISRLFSNLPPAREKP